MELIVIQLINNEHVASFSKQYYEYLEKVTASPAIKSINVNSWQNVLANITVIIEEKT